MMFAIFPVGENEAKPCQFIGYQETTDAENEFSKSTTVGLLKHLSLRLAMYTVFRKKTELNYNPVEVMLSQRLARVN